jgi:DNA-binding transcriptional regulator YiaG
MFLLVAVLVVFGAVVPSPIAAKMRAKRTLPPLAMRRAIRLGAGLSQSDVAEILGVHRETVHRWEAGDRTPRGALLVAYVDLLDKLRAGVS